MNPTSAEVCDLLPWDSKFFDRTVARVNGERLDADLAIRVVDWAKANRVDCLYLLARSDDPLTAQMAQHHGFQLVDIRMTFKRQMIDGAPPAAHPQAIDVQIRPAQPKDLPALQSLARVLHQDSRFFNDPRFSKHQCEELYSTWITLECQGRAKQVLVCVSPEDKPQGYISCHFDPESRVGKLGLVGVGEEARNKGVGKALVGSALSWFASKDILNVTVVTQARNIGAQRLYQRSGFLTSQIQFWYHKWFC